jgi:hypothetical protein
MQEGHIKRESVKILSISASSTHTLKESGSNLGLLPTTLNEDICGFPSSLQKNNGKILRKDHYSILSIRVIQSYDLHCEVSSSHNGDYEDDRIFDTAV